jgi:hypothetical protein
VRVLAVTTGATAAVMLGALPVTTGATAAVMLGRAFW